MKHDSTVSSSICAFFDVDETLWAAKSLLDIYEHHLCFNVSATIGAERVERFRAQISDRKSCGGGRQTLNRWFYETYFEGLKVDHVDAVCRSWWHARSQIPGFLHHAVLAEAKAHLAKGHRVALLTGSFELAVRPLRVLLGNVDVLATPLEQRNGYFTGKLVGEPMIGEGKAKALVAYLADMNVDVRDCWGYSDDASDMPFLSLLGNPVVVGGGEFAYFARNMGWDVIDMAMTV